MLLLPDSGFEPAPGEVVAYRIYGAKIKSIDPATCGDTTSAGIQGAFYEGLFAYHYLKRPQELIPLLAQDMPEVSEDNLTYTFKIKKGVLYHRNPCFAENEEGIRTREVVADDFVLAFKRISDFHIESELALPFIQDRIVGVEKYRERTKAFAKGDFSRYDLPLEGVRALDSHTLEIRLREPFPQLVYVLAISNYAPFPHEVIDYYLTSEPDGAGGRRQLAAEDREPEIHEKDAAVGTGAYYLHSWVRGNLVVLRRNPDFRHEAYPSQGEGAGEDYPGDREMGLLEDAGKPLPFIDVWHYKYVQEDNPAWMMFLTKQVDTMSIPPEIYEDVITPDKELADKWGTQGISLSKSTYPAVYWLAFNMQDPVVGKSKSLRQAMSLAFNVEQYIDVLHNGRGVPAKTYTVSTFDGAREAGPSPYARFDLQQARAKLAQAKRELVQAGVLSSVNDPIPPLTIDFGGVDQRMSRFAQMCIEQFGQIGLEIEVELQDWPRLQEKVHKKQSQIYSMGWHADYPDTENFLQLYYSPNIELGTNNTNYANPEFDRLYESIRVMFPSPQRTEIYGRMLGMLNEDVPALLLSEPISMGLRHSWVHNSKPSGLGYGYGKYRRIDVQERRKAGGR
jgi:ABC-type transport system substrate-binding protein